MITRDNYEEFFLLYVDNELSAAARSAVEDFVKDHPDLDKELRLWQQSVLQPDKSLFFGNKDSLLKSSEPAGPAAQESSLLRGELPVWGGESAFVDEESYPVYLLSYIDNELDEESRRTVEEYIRQNPLLARELSHLQQAVLRPDPRVLFEGKENLYRYENSRKGIFFLPWTRMAIALLILLSGLFLLYPGRPGKSKTGSEKDASSNRGNGFPVAGEAVPGNATASGRAPVPAHASASDSASAPPRSFASGSAGAVPAREAGSAPGERPGAKDGSGQKKNLPGGNISVRKEDPGSREIAMHNRATPPQTASFSQGAVSVMGSPLLSGPLPLGQRIMTSPGSPLENTPDNGIAATEENSLAEQFVTGRKNSRLRGIFRTLTRVLDKNTHADETESRHAILVGNFQIASKE